MHAEKQTVRCYCRRACAICRLAEEFITSRGVSIAEWMDADEAPLDSEAALELARSAERVWVIRAGKLSRYDMAKPPGTQALLSQILAPSGSLRAPSVLVNGCLLVGFQRAAYEQIFDPG